MTSNGGRLTPDVTWVSLPQPVPLDGATSTQTTRRSTMSQSRTRFMGMDVHTDPIAVAYVAQDHGAAVTYLGTIGTRQWDIAQLLRKMQSQATHLIFVSAAGPCGYWLERYRRKKDDACWVVAPSLLPKKAGDRVNTDRRDALPRARLARAGARTAVSVPTVDDAAIRDLRRAREETLSALKDAKVRLQAFLLRHERRYTGPAHGGPAHLRWLSEVVCPPPAQQSVFHASVRAVTAHPARLQRLDQALHEHGQAWRLHAVVEALQALRGVPCTVAVTMGAAIGALPRCDTPRALLQCL